MKKKCVRSVDMPEKLITITAVGLTEDEKQELEKRNVAMIHELNHRHQGNVKYQLVFC